MTDLVWREPVCEPLDRISPSALNTLLECPKRLAFQRDPETRHWQGRSTRTALGIVAHRLTELVAGGRAPTPPDRKDWLEARWDELVGQEHLDMQQAWANRTVPEPKDWPGYVATRVRLLRRLADIPAATRPSKGHHPGESPNESPLPWIEDNSKTSQTGSSAPPTELRTMRVACESSTSSPGSTSQESPKGNDASC